MANPLFGQFGRREGNIVSQVENFKKQFNINPREEVQRLLNSGRMSQAQFNQFAQIAEQYAPLFKK
jgi:hypothetical protein